MGQKTAGYSLESLHDVLTQEVGLDRVMADRLLLVNRAQSLLTSYVLNSKMVPEKVAYVREPANMLRDESQSESGISVSDKVYKLLDRSPIVLSDDNLSISHQNILLPPFRTQNAFLMSLPKWAPFNTAAAYNVLLHNCNHNSEAYLVINLLMEALDRSRALLRISDTEHKPIVTSSSKS